MNILIANDDGVYKEGIRTLANALATLPDAKIYVFGPDRERTCSSHGMTLRDPIILKEYDKTDFDRVEMAYSCSGTPSDCVKVGLELLEKKGINIDLICTGVNHGPNIGGDIIYSGTVASAMEGPMHKIPSIAFSQCSHRDENFPNFMKIVPEIVKKYAGLIPPGVMVNVNAPDIPWDEIKGYRICRVGPFDYSEHYDIEETEDGNLSFKYKMEDLDLGDHDEWDNVSVRKGYISISAMYYHYDVEEIEDALRKVKLDLQF